MATYAIGDIQGCYSELMHLLDKVQFSEKQDTLWLTGDLVNRGPDSLATLRFIKALPNMITVLGNHDLHLLALYYLKKTQNSSDTLSNILMAPDCDELCSWLTTMPLLYYDSQLDYVLTHAGIYPGWDLTAAQTYADEVKTILNSDEKITYFQKMYGNEPALWTNDLTNFDRSRFITNAFTRMRFVTNKNELELNYKGTVRNAPTNLIPWFQYPDRKNKSCRILFGHWAALAGETLGEKNIFPLDTGCVWGKQLTCLRLDDQSLFHFASKSVP